VSAGEAVLFIDRDGTLVEEPPDEQVDSLAKVRLMPDVIPALRRLCDAGYTLVLVSNQDGIGTPRFPEQAFRETRDYIQALFESQGIRFAAEYYCPHYPQDGCHCRKPATGLLEQFLAEHPIDRTRSAVIGDRDTDLELARNIGVTGLRVRLGGTPEETWGTIAARLTQPPRRAASARKTKETDVAVAVDLDAHEPQRVHTGIGFFDHMLEQIARHGGFALDLRCDGDLQVDEHHTVEDCALALGEALRAALGDKRGLARYGFLLPMDEALAQVAVDLSGRPYFVFEGKFERERVGGLPTELVPHFFRSLAQSLGAAIHIDVQGDNSHHMVEACFKGVGRALRQALAREGDVLPTTKGVL
jgi:imidazoleglycerol-phosphate dehydratase / histidinol-phosphatase